MKLSFYIFLSLLTLILSYSKRILEINRDSFSSYLESNKYNENKKLLLIFYRQNSTFSEEALNVIENDIIKEYNSETGIDFGKINIDAENNLWLNLQFKIRTIPHIILIKGNYFYELNQKPDKYSIKEFINKEKDDSDKKRIPEEINITRKILIVTNLTIKLFRNFFYNIFKIRLNKNIIIFIIIFILIIILCFIFWIIKIIISFICCKLCCKKICKKNKSMKKKKKNGGEKAINIIKEEKIDDKSSSDSGVSGSEVKDKDDQGEENIDKNMPEINNDIFNEEISSEKIKEKYKKD